MLPGFRGPSTLYPTHHWCHTTGNKNIPPSLSPNPRPSPIRSLWVTIINNAWTIWIIQHFQQNMVCTLCQANISRWHKEARWDWDSVMCVNSFTNKYWSKPSKSKQLKNFKDILEISNVHQALTLIDRILFLAFTLVETAKMTHRLRTIALKCEKTITQTLAVVGDEHHQYARTESRDTLQITETKS